MIKSDKKMGFYWKAIFLYFWLSVLMVIIRYLFTKEIDYPIWQHSFVIALVTWIGIDEILKGQEVK